MKSLTTLLLLGVLRAAVSMPTHGHETKGFLDETIAKLIENIKPSLANLTLPNVNATIEQSGIYAHLVTNNVKTLNLDSFIELAVNTTLIPLRLDNITLYWEEVFLDGDYFLSGVVDNITQGPIDLDGGGAVSATLRGLILTGAADFKLIDGNLQITELYGLNVHLDTSIITLENLLGGGDLEEILNVFFSFFVPQLLNDQGRTILEALSPTLKDLLNEVLADIL